MSGSGWSIELRGRVGELELELSFETEADITLVVGPNGAGKTTLLRTIAGASTGLTGRIGLGREVLLDSSAGRELPPEQRRIGYVPQGFALFPHLDAVHNVAFGLSGRDEPLVRARQVLRHLGAEHLATRRVDRLSGGERQRVALARALAIEPRGLLLDEPLAALDVARRRKVRAILAEHLREASRPALVVTHDVRDIDALGGELVVIEDGRVIQRGTAQQLRREPQSEFVAELLAL